MKCEEYYDDPTIVCDLYDYCISMALLTDDVVQDGRWSETYVGRSTAKSKTYVFHGADGFGYPDTVSVLTTT